MDRIVKDLSQLVEFVKRYFVNAVKTYYQNNLEKFLIGDILNDRFRDYPPNEKRSKYES